MRTIQLPMYYINNTVTFADDDTDCTISLEYRSSSSLIFLSSLQLSSKDSLKDPCVIHFLRLSIVQTVTFPSWFLHGSPEGPPQAEKRQLGLIN